DPEVRPAVDRVVEIGTEPDGLVEVLERLGIVSLLGPELRPFEDMTAAHDPILPDRLREVCDRTFQITVVFPQLRKAGAVTARAGFELDGFAVVLDGKIVVLREIASPGTGDIVARVPGFELDGLVVVLEGAGPVAQIPEGLSPGVIVRGIGGGQADRLAVVGD